MKVLVTGATGFVGKAVCEALCRGGHELIVITRNSAKARSVIPAPHQSLEWDFSDTSIQDPLNLLHHIDGVIHLAGEPILEKRWNSQIESKLYNSRVLYTQNLIALLKSHCKTFPQVFISASAIGFYGDRGDDILDETSSPGSGFLARICQDWEKSLLEAPLNQTRKVALRIGIVLGRGGGALDKMIEPISLGLGGPMGDGKQWMSWIHLEDLVQILIDCLHNSKLQGPINCCSPNPVTNQEFTDCVADHLNTRAAIPVPKIALRLALGKGASALFASQRIQPQKLKQIGYQFKYSTLNQALADILNESYSQGYSEFQKKCWIPLPIDKVFKFFSEAANLEKITPPWLQFHILSQSSVEMNRGTIIDYRLKIHGFPAKWRTEISSWNPPHDFTDVQLKGPYRVWKHTHRFSELGSGTLMEDRVIYQLPVGFLGKLFGGALVKKDVATIFTYRNEKIYELLFRDRQ